jgi:hypothetical protein
MNTHSTLNKKHFIIALSLMLIAAVLGSGIGLPAHAEDLVTPIPPGPETTLPDYIGAPAEAHPSPNTGVPQNPLLAPNPFNAGHLDPWQSDAADIPGPLGLNPETRSTTLSEAQGQKYPNTPPWIFDCIVTYFDSHGRPIAVCFSPSEATVVVVDPDTLEVLASYPLGVPEGDPYKGAGRQRLLQSMGAIYSYNDNLYRFHVVAKGNQIYSLIEEETEENLVLKLDESSSFDLSQVVDPDCVIVGVLLDSQGRIWFTTAASEDTPARLHVLNPAKSTHPYADVRSNSLPFNGEWIQNTFALTMTGKDSSAAYVVTSKNLYRIDAGPDDKPYVVWAEPYDNINVTRDGQYETGSGTSPTILGEGKYVAITDNAEHLQVVVYRTDEPLDPNEQRVVCEVPVFDFPGGGAGALSNSLIGSRLSIIASNNYGYWFDWETGKLKQPGAPGLERIDIDPNGRGCTKVWVNTEVAQDTSPRLSTRTGLIYTISRELDMSKVDADHPFGLDVYYWTAVDFRTGETVWKKLAGTGSMYDSFYTGIGFGPNGALYTGGYGGFMTIRDTP